MNALKKKISSKQVADILLRRNQGGEHPFVLFLGAGASLTSGIPKMQELVEKFLIDMSIPAMSVKRMDEFEKIKLFSELLENQSKHERFDWFYLLFKDATPSEGYKALAALIREGYFDIILSTNVDALLEESLKNDPKLREKDISILIRDREPQEFIIDQLNNKNPRIKLIKLHGDLMSRILYFTPTETFEFPPKISDELTRLFLTRDLLMVGYSATDLDFVKCLTKNERSLIYVNPSPPKTKELQNLAIAYYRGFKIVQGDEGKFDFFFVKLGELLNLKKVFVA